MKTLKGYAFSDTESEVVNSISFLIPCKKVEIGYSVREGASLPVVEETLLRLLRASDSISFEIIRHFFGFTDRELESVLSPLEDLGLIVSNFGNFSLTDSGNCLFTNGADGRPTISKTESRCGEFKVDQISNLPMPFEDISRYLKFGIANLFIEIPPRSSSEVADQNADLREMFSKYFSSFIKDETFLDLIRNDRLTLYKTNFCRTTEEFSAILQLVGKISRSGVGESVIDPLDELPNRSGRLELRNMIVEKAKNESLATNLSDCVNYLNLLSDEDLFSDVCKGEDFNWARFFGEFQRDQTSEYPDNLMMVFGSSLVKRNLDIVKAWCDTALAGKGSGDHSPVEVLWIRPLVRSWGSSHVFFDEVEEWLGRSGTIKRKRITVSLAENRIHKSAKKRVHQIHVYESFFDDLKTFTLSSLPPELEVVIVRGVGAIFLAHAAKPPLSSVICPIGFATQSKHIIDKFLGGIAFRSLPKRNSSKLIRR